MAEHPEDKKIRKDGEDYGRRFAHEFLEDHKGNLAMLIGEWSDSSAKQSLASLRERFWSGAWEKAKHGRISFDSEGK